MSFDVFLIDFFCIYLVVKGFETCMIYLSDKCKLSSNHRVDD